MTSEPDDLVDSILASIRRVIRAIDLNSKQLEREYGVSGPQLVTLRAVARLGPISVTPLARAVNLSQPTVTGILFRLEQQELLVRERNLLDRRAVTSTITPRGIAVLKETPTLLEDRFRRELNQLEDWEQTQTLSTLQRIASMMEAQELAADPILATGPLAPDPAIKGEVDAANRKPDDAEGRLISG